MWVCASCLHPVYILSISCLHPAYILSISCLHPVYILSTSCNVHVYIHVTLCTPLTCRCACTYRVDYMYCMHSIGRCQCMDGIHIHVHTHSCTYTHTHTRSYTHTHTRGCRVIISLSVHSSRPTHFVSRSTMAYLHVTGAKCFHDDKGTPIPVVDLGKVAASLTTPLATPHSIGLKTQPHRIAIQLLAFGQ